MSGGTRRAILGEAALVLAAYACVVALITGLLWRSGLHLTVAALWAFALSQAAFVSSMVIALIARKAIRQSALARSNRVRGRIRESIAAVLSGDGTHIPLLRAMAERHGSVVEECLLDMLPAVRGDGRRVLSEMAYQLGYVGQWERALDSSRTAKRRRAGWALAAIAPEYGQRARAVMMESPDSELRLEGLRMIARCGDPNELSLLLERFHGLSLLERALLTEDLRPNAAVLCGVALPAVLKSEDCSRILAPLEMLGAWKRNVRLPVLHELLGYRDAKVRAAALRALPYEVEAPTAMPAVVQRLADDDPEVRAAAAFAAGRLQFEASLVALERGLSDPDSAAARSCAYAMALFGARGLDGLERQVVTMGGQAAAAAMEALEYARTGRVGSAQ